MNAEEVELLDDIERILKLVIEADCTESADAFARILAKFEDTAMRRNELQRGVNTIMNGFVAMSEDLKASSKQTEELRPQIFEELAKSSTPQTEH